VHNSTHGTVTVRSTSLSDEAAVSFCNSPIEAVPVVCSSRMKSGHDICGVPNGNTNSEIFSLSSGPLPVGASAPGLVNKNDHKTIQQQSLICFMAMTTLLLRTEKDVRCGVSPLLRPGRLSLLAGLCVKKVSKYTDSRQVG